MMDNVVKGKIIKGLLIRLIVIILMFVVSWLAYDPEFEKRHQNALLKQLQFAKENDTH